MMHKFETLIYWSNADNTYLAKAPALPVCEVHGDTQQGALASICQAVDLWLETAREFGDPILKPSALATLEKFV